MQLCMVTLKYFNFQLGEYFVVSHCVFWQSKPLYSCSWTNNCDGTVTTVWYHRMRTLLNSVHSQKLRVDWIQFYRTIKKLTIPNLNDTVNENMVRLLIENGADLNIVDMNSNYTILITAIKPGKFCVEHYKNVANRRLNFVIVQIQTWNRFWTDQTLTKKHHMVHDYTSFRFIRRHLLNCKITIRCFSFDSFFKST